MLNERLMAMKRYRICSFPLAMLEVISLITSSGDVAFLSEGFLNPSHSTNSGDSTVSNIVIIIILEAPWDLCQAL